MALNYYDFLKIEQAYFVWHKADDGYRWVENAISNSMAGSFKSEPPFLVISQNATGFISSFPLENDPDLFLQFAKKEPTAENILAFANQYGCLTAGEPIKITGTIQSHIYPLEGESLNFLQREKKEMKNAVALWEYINDGNKEALSSIILWDNNSVKYNLDGKSSVIASNTLNKELFSRFSPGNPIMPAKCFLQSIINNKLRGKIAPKLLFDNENNLVPYLMPDDLLTAMWYQFYLAVIGERKYKRCEICLYWENVTGNRKNWKKHKTCAANERVKKCLLAKKEVKNGKHSKKDK